ncbi:MAG: helix-turn-helix transcriptional regulator [Clostridiales bacterium]|nr:helix-turn-helix transcriptional regulator [Clostridiales bacterium]
MTASRAIMRRSIGRRIQKCREKAGISQETLAEKVSLSSTSISNIERGANYPTFENFIRIANVLEVPADALLADVLDKAYVAQATRLSAVLESVPMQKRQEIFAVVEIMANGRL